MRIKKLYVGIAALLLIVSTGVWSLAAARLAQGNADQLADGFLFENAQTFSGAQFPAAHTQLLKWPLFWLLSLTYNARLAYMIATVALALFTVGMLAYVLYRIDRRPLVFGTLCLGMACVLVTVPAYVQGGMTAPLGLAMVAGRNIEYILYIASLALFARAAGMTSWRWVSGAVLLSLLLASDRFFLPVTIGGGLGLLLTAYVWNHPSLTGVARRWVLGSAVAWLISGVLLWVARQFTYVVGPSNSPYRWIDGLNNVHPAVTGLAKGTLLNLGITGDAGGPTVITAAVNMIVALVVVYAVVKVVSRIKTTPQKVTTAQLLAMMLLLSSAVVVVLYVSADHPYVADARYLSLLFFTGAIAGATYMRYIEPQPSYYYAAGTVLAIATVIGIAGVWQHTDQLLVHSELLRRNTGIAQALSSHPDKILVGDYWRVLPVKALTNGAGQQILPLTTCVQPKQVLTSTSWNKSLQSHSFAYLLPILPAGTPYGTCTVQFVEFLYGPPSSVIVIAGTARSPAEVLLIYNEGAADNHDKRLLPPKPVLGAPTEGEAKPTGSMITPLIAPS